MPHSHDSSTVSGERDGDGAPASDTAATAETFRSAMQRLADASFEIGDGLSPDAGAAAGQQQPDTLVRIEAGMARLAAQLSQPGSAAPYAALTALGLPHQQVAAAPAIDEPWDRQSAEALAQAYASEIVAKASPAPQRGHEAAPYDASASLGSTTRPVNARLAAQLAGVAASVQQSLTEGRCDMTLPALARRFEEFEQRFSAMIERVANHADADGLRRIEGHIAALVTQLTETKARLARLDDIGADLDDLKHRLGDDEILRLFGPLVPTDTDLEAFAVRAGEKVVQHVRPEIAGTSAWQAVEERISRLDTAMAHFGEDRRREAFDSAAALDAMQQAMRHLLDRIDTACEQMSASSQHARDMPGTEFLRSSPAGHLGARKRARGQKGWGSSHPLGDMAGHAGGTAVPDLEAEHKAFVAMARSAAEKASAAFPDVEPAHGPSTAGKRSGLRARLRLNEIAAGAMRPGSLLGVSVAAFLLAGYWLLSGPRLHLMPAPASLQHNQPPAAARAAAPPSVPGKQAEHAEAGDPAAPANRGQVPTGIVVQDNSGEAAAVLSARHRAHLANLSSRTGQLAAQAMPSAGSAPPQPASAPAVPGVSVGKIEMPPALIGPHSLRQAAANGDAIAQFEVAARFAGGKGVRRDFEQAALWYHRAAAQGMSAAQYELAAIFEHGLGVKADPARARVWYARAAEQGNVKAMHNLAVLNAGQAGGPDHVSAARWFTAAAERGLSASQFSLAVLHERGDGVARDLRTAYKWYALAAAGGDEKAARARDRVATQLDRNTLKSASREVEDWRSVPADSVANSSHTGVNVWRGLRTRPSSSGL